MRLARLSDSYVSDSIQDAASLPLPPFGGPVHFAALCRGLVVLFALALPLGLTLAASQAPQAAASDRGPGLTVQAVSNNL